MYFTSMCPCSLSLKFELMFDIAEIDGMDLLISEKIKIVFLRFQQFPD